MEKYYKIICHLEAIEKWDNEETFLIDLLAIGNAKLFLKCYEEMQGNSIVVIAPLLRNIQENLIAKIGLIENVITMDDFISKDYSAKKIMKAIEDKNHNIKKEDFALANQYFIGIKEILNNFCHTNFEGMMTFFTERFQVPESMAFNKTMIKTLITFLEIPFIVLINNRYNLEVEVPSLTDFNKELKKIGTLRYITRHFPESIKKFIDSSEVLQNYYKNIINDFKYMTVEFKNFATKNKV
ncbi:MAG: hypothetical protein FWE36_00070 [Erysipelotrichales bacterium]|nr:hypothetical protein [Erysipelotrichales bacterium]